MDKRTIVGATIICIAILAVWVMIPLVGYILLREEWGGGSCDLQNYRGHLCEGVLDNKTLCVTPEIEKELETMVADTLCDWNSNGTHCYQNVKSSVCQFYFGPFNVEDAGSCDEWCDDVNYTRPWNEVPPQDLQGCNDYNGTTDELNCSESFYYDNTTSILTWVQTISNLSVVSNSIGIVGYVLAIVAACFNRSSMFRFPSLLLVYWCIARFIYHSATLLECNIDYVFCIIQDTLCLFAESLAILLTLFHTIILFSSVWFPTYAQRMFALYRNRIHCGVVVFSVTVSLIASGILAGLYDTENDIIFYTYVPFYFCSSIIAVLIGLVMYSLITRNEKQFRATCRAECSAEVKLTAILTFNAAFIITAITKFFLFRVYFFCVSAQSCPIHLDAYAHAIYAFLGFCNLVLCLAPCVVLVYVNPVGIIKKYFNMALQKFSSKTRKNSQDML